MGLAGLTHGMLSASGEPLTAKEHLASFRDYYKGRIPAEEVARIRQECLARGGSAHEALMERAGWPAVEFDGKLLVSHQDALLLGGKVQAPAGYADHVVFLYPNLCETCENRICVEICSGEAITMTPRGQPQFDREKCIHCGACVWNCTQAQVEFRAGTGGLHSTEN
jgi:electron-transferring-flavoprotein dehydrogenase